LQERPTFERWTRSKREPPEHKTPPGVFFGLRARFEGFAARFDRSQKLNG